MHRQTCCQGGGGRVNDDEARSRLAVVTMLLAAYNTPREAAVIALYVDLTKEIPLDVLRQAARIVAKEEPIMTNPVPMLLKAAKRVNVLAAYEVNPLATLPESVDLATPEESRKALDTFLERMRSKSRA